MVASTLGLPNHQLNMRVRRLGGAFGGKISGPNLPAAAAAVAAVKTNRPVRLSMDLTSNMEMLGKRLPYLAKYKAALDSSGRLAGVGMRIYCDSGYSYNESTADNAARFARNVYKSRAWNIRPSAVLTDKGPHINIVASYMRVRAA